VRHARRHFILARREVQAPASRERLSRLCSWFFVFLRLAQQRSGPVGMAAAHRHRPERKGM
jgi:hypothetical protein